MKRSTVTTAMSGALLAVAAGLLTAAPSQAANVSLPAGCSTQSSPSRASEVSNLECTNLSNGADLARYTGLTSLQIGSYEQGAPAVTLTKLPKLPASLTYVSILADKATDVSSLYKLRKLTWLTVNGPTVNDLASVAKNKEMTRLSLDGPGYFSKDLSPLAKLSKLESLVVWGVSPKTVMADEGTWTAGNFGRGPDGKYLLPRNHDFSKDGKQIGKEYRFNAANGKIMYNGASKQIQTIKVDGDPKIKSMPKLKEISIWLSRSINVAGRAEWTEEKNNRLVVSGMRAVGSTLTVRHKFGMGMREYADKFQWNRNGKPISGATGKTYKLRSADRGQRISVTGTDAKGGGFAGMFRYIPYSQTVLVTVRL